MVRMIFWFLAMAATSASGQLIREVAKSREKDLQSLVVESDGQIRSNLDENRDEDQDDDRNNDLVDEDLDEKELDDKNQADKPRGKRGRRGRKRRSKRGRNRRRRRRRRNSASEALRAAKAELAAQIKEMTKAKEDTEVSLGRAKTDKSNKEAELATARKWTRFWQKKEADLRDAIKKHNEDIQSLTALSKKQQSTIDKLIAAHKGKHKASQIAHDLENLITSLRAQIKSKMRVKNKALRAHVNANKRLVKDCSAKTQEYDRTIAGLSKTIKETRKEMRQLQQTHTEISCAKKRRKKERICKRCARNTKPCGDKCIPLKKVCHYGIGCACRKGGRSLLQTGGSSETIGHPLHHKLNNAKAEIRKIIYQHKRTIDSIRQSLTMNEQQQSKLAREKSKALGDYNAALRELADERKRLQASHKEAQKNKRNAEANLEKTAAEGEAAIKNLGGQLRKQIKDLKAERKSTENARAKHITACKETQKSQMDAQAEVIGAMNAEIAQLKQELKDAQGKLRAIKKKHGVLMSTDAGKEIPVEQKAQKVGASRHIRRHKVEPDGISSS